MNNKTNLNGKKVDDSSQKTNQSPPAPKSQVVYSYHRPTFDSILNEYPELTQFFELKQVTPINDSDDNTSKNKNASASKKSASNGKFSLNKIFNFSSNKSDQKSVFGFSFGKSKNKNSKPQNPPPSASAVRESLQRAALSLTNSLEINDIIEKQLKREYLKTYAKIKNIPNLCLNNNKPPEKKPHKKGQKLNTNILTYSYIIKIFIYLKYQENLKICEAQHDHCEKHKKYIQNLLEIVNIVNKEFPNFDLIINGKLLNYSIMNDENLLQAAAQTPPSSTTPTNSPLDKFRKTEIGSTVKDLRERTGKHEKRRKLLNLKINQLITEEKSSRSTIINDILNKLFDVNCNNETSKINSSPIPSNISGISSNGKDSKILPTKRKVKGRSRKTSPSATKSYSSSNLAQLSKSALDLPIINPKLANFDKDDKDADLNESGSINEHDNKNLKINRNNSYSNNAPVSKSSSSSNLLQVDDPKHSSDESSNFDKLNKNDNDYNSKSGNDDININVIENQLNDSSSPGKDILSLPSFEDESDTPYNSAASSLSSNINFPDYDEVINEFSLHGSLEKIPTPSRMRHSDMSDDQSHISFHRMNKGHFESSDDVILSDSESAQSKNKKIDADYEYSEYSDNDSNLLLEDIDENDEDLTEFQNLDENDILFEETLKYIEDKEGLFFDFELLIEKASESTEFKSDTLSSTIRKIKKSPKDSGILTLKLCQTFEDIFLTNELKKKEQQRQQQIKMEQDAIIAAQKNRLLPNPVIPPSPSVGSPSMNNKNQTEIANINKTEDKSKDIMRFLFIMFSKYIFNEIYVSTFHREFFYVQDFLFSNSILNALDQIPSISSELKPSLPYIPTDAQNLKLSQLARHESFRVYSDCIKDVMMLQFESSLVDFAYAAFKILERIQKLASEILFDKKIEEELEKIRDGAASSYTPSNINFSSDNFQVKSKSSRQSFMCSSTSDSEKGNSNSLPKANISDFSLVDNDEESSNKESNNDLKHISSSASNSSVSLQKEIPSMYSTKKSKMQLKADCQLSCDQLLDITTVIVIIAGPFDLRRMIELFAPYLSGLRLSSQLEFAFISFQSVCNHIVETFDPEIQLKMRRKKKEEEMRQYEENAQKEEEMKQYEENGQKEEENEQNKEEIKQDDHESNQNEENSQDKEENDKKIEENDQKVEENDQKVEENDQKVEENDQKVEENDQKEEENNQKVEENVQSEN